MKKEYIQPELEIKQYSLQDVLTASNPDEVEVPDITVPGGDEDW